MKNDKLVAVFIGLIIILVGLSFVVNSALASSSLPDTGTTSPDADVAPIEDSEPMEEVIVEPSRRSSGSYIKVVPQPVYVWEVIKFGDNDKINGNDYVATFQRVLNTQINAGLVVDGIFGNLTLGAWENYQLVLWSIKNATL